MEMLLPIAVAYILSRPWNPIMGLLFWSGVTLAIISIWMSGSRGAAGAMLIEGLLLAGILLWQRPRGVSLRAFAVLLAVVVISAGGFSWLVSTGRVAGRSWSAFQTDRSLEATLGDRYRVGIDTLHMVRSHPWAGVGVGCFETVFPNYLTFATDQHWTHAHNDVFEAAAETGLPGVVIILVSLVFFFPNGVSQPQGAPEE